MSFVNQRDIAKMERGTWNVDANEYVKPLGENTQAWANFAYMYNRDNVGRPSMFPNEWLQNKSYKIKNFKFFYFLVQINCSLFFCLFLVFSILTYKCMFSKSNFIILTI